MRFEIIQIAVHHENRNVLRLAGNRTLRALWIGHWRRAAVLAVTVAFLIGCGDHSSAQNEWIWRFADRPTKPLDAFPYLLAADRLVANETSTADTSAFVLASITTAVDCAKFSGRPNRFNVGGETFSDRLVSGNDELTFKGLTALVDLLMSTANARIEEDRYDDAAEVARNLLVLSYFITRNGEDKVLATLRVSMWWRALEVLRTIATAQGQDELLPALEAQQRKLDAVNAEVRDRNPNRLYYPFGE